MLIPYIIPYIFSLKYIYICKKKKTEQIFARISQRIKKRFQGIRWDRKFDSRTKPTVSCDLFSFFFKDIYKSSIYIYIRSAYNDTTDVKFWYKKLTRFKSAYLYKIIPFAWTHVQYSFYHNISVGTDNN